MPYVSHAVRSIMRDPQPDESIGLVLTPADDADPEDIHAAVVDLGGSVDRTLALGRIVVEVPQDVVADVCEFENLDTVETDAVLGIT